MTQDFRGRHEVGREAMRRVLRVGTTVVLATTVACGPGPVPNPPPSTPIARGEPAAQLQRRLRILRDAGFSGVVLVALRDTIVLYQPYGFTDGTGAHPITLDTRFNIASISKQFTASAILILREQGQLSLTDSLGRFFPWLGDEPRRITIHQLLTHTAGLAQNYAADGVADMRAAIDAVFSTSRTAPVGTTFTYSNDAYSVLAAVVEHTSGRPYERFVTDALLRPAHLTHTAFWGEVDVKDRKSVV